MIDNEERLKIREKAKDFILSAGSPVTNGQLTTGLNTNHHMVARIIEEFKEHKMIKPITIGEHTSHPLTVWEATPKLKKTTGKDLDKLTTIKKPRK